MQFIVTNCLTDAKQSVTRECVDRIKGEQSINALMKQVEQTNQPIEVHFEGDYDLMVTF